MGLIGRGWKPCEGWSRPVLIGRGLARNHVVRIHCVTLSTQPHTNILIVLDSVVGGDGGGGTPGPIPNPEAKPSSADGTAPETVWESRTPPDNHHTIGGHPVPGGLRSSCLPTTRHRATRQVGCRRRRDRVAQRPHSHAARRERISCRRLPGSASSAGCATGPDPGPGGIGRAGARS